MNEVSDLMKLFDETPDTQQPLPSDAYECEAIKGELFTSKSGTKGYKITWQVVSGEHTGRWIWQDLWLSAKAMAFSKERLKHVGINTSEQLSQPIPAGRICKLVVVQRQSDNGQFYSEVKSVEFLRQEVDPFAPNVLQSKPVETVEAKATEAITDENESVDTEKFFAELRAMAGSE